MDLFGLAANNADAIRASFDNVVASAEPAHAERITRFADLVGEMGAIGVNMRQMPLLSFLTLGQLRNAYEWAEARGALSSRPRDDLLQQELGDHYKRRTAFDDSFEDGRHFRYGALTIGGIGVTSFGDYCAVFANDRVIPKCRVAYLPGDSLHLYISADLRVDTGAISNEIAPHSHRAFLAAVNHSDDLAATNQDEWPGMLCCNDSFTEAIFVGPVVAADLEAVRIGQPDHSILFYFAFEDVRGNLGIADRFMVDAFVMILEHLQRNSIPLEVIEDA